MNRRQQSGFTLVELVIVVVVLGVMFIMLAPLASQYTSSMGTTLVAQQSMNNQLVGNALLNFASVSTSQGTLPAPYTGNGYTMTVYNPSDTSAAGTALTNALLQAGLTSNAINDDGYSSQRVRGYQRVTGLTQQVPLYFQSGPMVTLNFQYGAIYSTLCMKSDTTCNPTPATGVPGVSPAMSASNFSTWASGGTDYASYLVSTLPLQKNMLGLTVQRMDKVRDTLLGYFRAQQVTAVAGDTTNWYPAGAASLAGANAGTNQGCYDGWYDLSTSNVLATIGLGSTEYGVTAWGGRIEYCRDYDPTLGSKGAGTTPYYGAIRINATPSNGVSGQAPDSAVMGNNIILTF
jgi:prepilin-type N-terminal cleavage/methylation domain-containing protein